MILRPSLHPSSRSRSRNAAVHSLCAGAGPEPSNPMTGIGTRWAGGGRGQAPAALLNRVMTSRRLMPTLGFSPVLVLQFEGEGTSAVPPPLFDHLVGAGEKRFRNGQSE